MKVNIPISAVNRDQNNRQDENATRLTLTLSEVQDINKSTAMQLTRSPDFRHE